MDRQNALGVPLLVAVEGPSGWDAHRVWQERVHEPRRPATANTPTISVTLGGSAGWDPLETWRLRVQRPRARK